MSKEKILEITDLDFEILKSNPPQLMIGSSGTTSTLGWKNASLEKYEYVTPPADGIYEFDFVAEAPVTGATTIGHVSASYHWAELPNDLKGIKVYASTNDITKKVDL